MFRKIYLAVASCVALVAFMGFSSTAFADHVRDPDCAATGNAFALTGFSVDTPDSHVASEVSGVTGTGLACGTAIHGNPANPFDPPMGEETLNDRADIQNPPGVAVNAAPSTDLPDGSYIGSAVVDAATWVFFLGGAVFLDNSAVIMRVDDDPAADCPAGSLACYRGNTETGHSWVWVEEDASGRTTLTIGPFYNDITGSPAGLTQIDDFRLCAYAGAVGGNSCGDGSDSSKWLQKNGAASVGVPPGSPRCNQGRGVYTVTVTNKAGDTTDPVSSCVPWIWVLGSGGSANVLPAPPVNIPDCEKRTVVGDHAPACFSGPSRSVIHP